MCCEVLILVVAPMMLMYKSPALPNSPLYIWPNPGMMPQSKAFFMLRSSTLR